LDDPIYLRTRAFVLSDDNPYFYRGPEGEGLGGPHSGLGMIWPLGIITRALTSRDRREIDACLAELKATHAGMGFLHESFSRTDASRFTRKWFAWADTLFGELILKVVRGDLVEDGKFGGRRGDRTPDLCIANAALSQLS
jgi:meiotically up-regulated gene 157 (Mug157) protein